MTVSSDALYESLEKDLGLVVGCNVSHMADSIPLMVRQFAARYMLDKFLSKLVPDDCRVADEAALQVFLESNSRCEAWKLSDCSPSSDEQMVNDFLQIMDNFFVCDLGSDVELNWGNISLNARCGPGASVGSLASPMYSKMYSSPLTTSRPFLKTLYRADINLWPEESIAESIRHDFFGSVVDVKGSRSSFVPKTTKVSRMISVEPTLNMFYQLGLGEIITKRLKRYFGIDLSTQPSINRWLAYLGSSVDATFGDGFATIDLSSASDSISLGLCSACLPPDWLSAMLELRSDATSIRIDKREFDVKLNMMSTMGNGFTFPFQTALFACIAAASVYQDDSLRSSPRGFGLNRPGMFSVFGDDIIVPTKAYERTLRLLRLLGFTPNPEKSFGSGSFRESCGHDYYHGYNVRPVFVRKLKTDNDLMVLTNLLVGWSARNSISLDNTLALCLKNLKFVNIVPMGESDDAGLRVPYSIATDFARLRLPKHRQFQSLGYVKRYSLPKRMRVLDGEIHVPKGVKRHIYNPPGLLMAYLCGGIRGSSISLTNWHPVYRTKRAVAPNWDHLAQPLEAAMIGTAESPASLARKTDQVLRHLLWDVKGFGRVRKTRTGGRS